MASAKCVCVSCACMWLCSSVCTYSDQKLHKNVCLRVVCIVNVCLHMLVSTCFLSDSKLPNCPDECDTCSLPYLVKSF